MNDEDADSHEELDIREELDSREWTDSVAGYMQQQVRGLPTQIHPDSTHAGSDLDSGPPSQNAARCFITDKKINLIFGGMKYEACIDFSGSQIGRIYLRSPGLEYTWMNNWSQARQISTLFDFAARITDTPLIHAHFASTAHAPTRIIRAADPEKNGQEAMTVDMIDPSIRAWLTRKGFHNDQDIHYLEREAGSLVTGLLMLMHVAPKCPPHFKIKAGSLVPPRKEKKPSRAFDDHEFEAVKGLYKKLNQPNRQSLDMSVGSPEGKTSAEVLDDASGTVQESASGFDNIVENEAFSDALTVDEQYSVERSDIHLGGWRPYDHHRGKQSDTVDESPRGQDHKTYAASYSQNANGSAKWGGACMNVPILSECIASCISWSAFTETTTRTESWCV